MNEDKQNEFNKRILELIDDIYRRVDKNYIETIINDLKDFLEENTK